MAHGLPLAPRQELASTLALNMSGITSSCHACMGPYMYCGGEINRYVLSEYAYAQHTATSGRSGHCIDDVSLRDANQRTVRACLAPARLLLEAIADLLRCLADGQVLAHVAALPVALLELHTQGEILSQCPGGRPAALLESCCTDQEVGACTRASCGSPCCHAPFDPYPVY